MNVDEKDILAIRCMKNKLLSLSQRAAIYYSVKAAVLAGHTRGKVPRVYSWLFFLKKFILPRLRKFRLAGWN